jgi:hypothetical protein
LESAERSEAKDNALRLSGNLFKHLMKTSGGARAVHRALPEVFSWVRFLPKQDVQAFLVEFVGTLEACAEIGNVAALMPVITACQETAEIYSDPELLKDATAPLDGTEGP